MKPIFALVPLALAMMAFPGGKAVGGDLVPVVVELFTSEGCSSCPPADALLASLSQQSFDSAQIIALGEHVDYWNQLGWKDRFSSHEYSKRQEEYAKRFGLDSVYTPQMTIDGRVQFVGNDKDAANKAIEAAANSPKTANVSLRREGDALQITVEHAGSGSPIVLLAITEDNLTTQIRAGENGGRQLTHQAVVRSLRPLGTITAGGFSARETLRLDPSWQPANLKAVVFVQDQKSGAIVGAASERLD